MITKKKAVKKITKKPTVKTSKKKLIDLGVMDVAFIIDATGSMGPYIQEAKKRVAEILKKIQADADLNIRVALIAYRDHPPQDYSFVTHVTDFGTIDEMDSALLPLKADGGGDHPEAVFDGIHELMNLSWRPKSERLVFLVGDAPPHNPCMCNITPAQLLKELKKLKVKLNAHSIAGQAETTAAFKLFVDATGGDISTGNTPAHMTAMYGFAVTGSAGTISTARSFVSSYDASFSYSNAASVSLTSAHAVGAKLGMSEKEVDETIDYLKSRDL